MRTFGAERVGMVTGDASVNADAPIIACTAEILANVALRGGRDADVGQAVMDEFHYYGDHQRGWAWQVPLVELPQTQFVLMSATLGDTTDLRADLTRRTGRPTALVAGAERPVPLSYRFSMDPLHEALQEPARRPRGAGLRGAPDAGGGGRASAGADERQRVQPRREGGDRRA
ncbi:hypothetical protein GCM10025868_44180 [Angustibacter aerolatus]|uniref:Helicase ATP-binding domain-containing protein n=1 Tax=Angustibacter aerolatus TaxID=1162965 RepID=A0ABQ6JMC1_9ACTN|nr:hypothetical protein GCM10025868_44180 [Angustibacter aerolatus]